MSEHFNKQVGKMIGREEAKKRKENWKKHGHVKTTGNFFGADIVQELLNRHGSVGIYIEYALTDSGVMAPVLQAVDAEGKIIKASSTGTMSLMNEDDGGANASNPCPPFCPTGD